MLEVLGTDEGGIDGSEMEIRGCDVLIINLDYQFPYLQSFTGGGNVSKSPSRIEAFMSSNLATWDGLWKSDL